jgi:DNA polymerase-4
MSRLCRDCLTLGETGGANPPEPARGARCPGCGSPRLVQHPELERLTIAHLDCDAFYASVEKRDRPELRDLPVIVGGGKRGVVTTCCYIARTYGPRSAMPMFKALKLCPEAVVIKPDFRKYQAESRRIMAILHELTPLVQPLSLDEAWLDLAGTEKLNHGAPALVLARAQARIEAEVGITVSIGLAANKFLAKIASDLDKPRGFSVIGAAEAEDFLKPKPVSILPGVGPAMMKALEKAGYATVGDLARADPKALVRQWGVYGLRLHDLAHARDAREVDPDSARKGISAETTFNDDLIRLNDLEDELWPCCEKVARRLRADGLAGRVAILKLRTADFRRVTRRTTLPQPVQTARSLFAAVREMLARELGQPYRLIGAGLADLTTAEDAAQDLFDQKEAKARTTEKALDRLRDRFGAGAVVSGRALPPKPT